MTTHSVGIIMNGVTGRMGLNQHLRRSIVRHHPAGRPAAERQRNHPAAAAAGGPQLRPSWKPSRRSAAASPGPPIWTRPWPIPTTPSTSTPRPPTAAPRPSARPSPPASTSIARSPWRTASRPRSSSTDCARKAGVKHGVVQDKLWLPGLLKLKTLRDAGLLRADPLGARRVRLLGVRRRHRSGPASLLELSQGGWRRHHSRHAVPLALRARQPVRQGEGGVLHWAPPTFPSAGTKQGKPYQCTADDSAYATFELEGGIIAHFNSSWCVRVRRDDLLTIQVDGTRGTRRGRPAPLLDPALRRHPAAGLEPRHRKPARTTSTAGRRCPSRPATTTPSSASGSCSCGTW